MQILLINNGQKPKDLLHNFLSNYGEVTEISFTEILSVETKNFVLCVLSGSGYLPLTGNQNLYENEMNFIRKADMKIIGICFGFEIIAKAFNENLVISETKKVGLKEINFRGNLYKVYQSHFWYLEKLKENSKLEILSNSKDEIEIIKLKGKNIFGLQFHPEHTEYKDGGKLIFEEILKM